ncbi:hypothetical protein BDM02DRAFT_3271099 [Thelephora ganbajun]|uniref:Uncharacterized protein n=1 Tax=Thelephora ganbajun TaxID=370292 RepID=A0ACB6Z969_THEGA|nr:hypothetical protein BDM02DRAFT_3271099 [Thelephora ganbajun]
MSYISASDYELEDEEFYDDDDEESDDDNSDDDDARSNAPRGKNLRDDLEAAFKDDFNFKGNFAVSKTFSLTPQPGLHIEGVGMIGLPLSEREAKLIEAAAIQAPFGRGTETVVDTTVRDTFEINPDRFSFKNPAWAEFLQQVMKTVAEGLGFPPTRPLPRAELYKLLLYKTGSHFLPHKDTEKTEGMFASLIIVLPSKFQGGEVHVSHGDNEDVFDVSPSSEFSISALAWYTDVTHEVKPVTSGYRLAISYNLVNTLRGLPAPHLPDVHSAVSKVQHIFHMWANGEYDREHSSGTIAYLLDHKYSDVSLEFAALKGKDAALVSNIQRVAEKEGVCLRFGNLVYEVSGDGGSDFGYGVPRMEIINDTEYRIEGLYDLEGDLAKLKRPIRLSEKLDLIPKRPFKGESPDEEDFEGYTGNVGAPMTHWYRRVALVMYLVGAGKGPEAPLDAVYASRKLKRWMAEGPTERNKKMAQFILDNGYFGLSYGSDKRGGMLHENALLLIDLAVEWNDFAMWVGVLKKSGIDKVPQLLGSVPLIRAWNVFPFNVTRPMLVPSQHLQPRSVSYAHASNISCRFEKLIRHQSSTGAKVEFINDLRAPLPHDQQDAARWCAQHMAEALSSITKPSVDDVKAFVSIAKTEGLTFFSNTILEQVIQFPHIFDFWVALAEELWKKRDSLVPPGGTPEEKSGSTAALNYILDRLIAVATPEYDWQVVYGPNATAFSANYRLPIDQHRVLKLLDLMTLTHRVHNSVQLITLASRPQSHLPTKYRQFVTPLIPMLKVRFRKYHPSHFPILDLFLRTLVERYLQDLLGGPSQQPEALVNKVDCRCEDCAKANRFLRSDAVTVTFRAPQQRRSHIESQLHTALQGGFTFTTITQGSPYTLQVTKKHETLEEGKWNTRVRNACAFFATVGTPDELVRIMGERYPDVQAALNGTKPYEVGNPTLVLPPGEGAATVTTSATEATASGAQAGPVVAGVKRKAEDEDVIDLSSD